MRVYNDEMGWLMLKESSAAGGEAKGHAVIGRRDLFASIYHQGMVPDDLEWWVEYVRSALDGAKGVVKCHGVVRSLVGGEAIGVLWSRAPGWPVYEVKKWGGTYLRVVYAIKVLEVLKEMLGRGLIYSDIKSDNIFKTPWNEPIFIDLLSMSTVTPISDKDGVVKKREFTKTTPEMCAPELIGSGSKWESTPFTLSYSAAVFIWQILKDNYPFDLIDAHGRDVKFAEIKKSGWYGRFAPIPHHLKVPDRGIPFKKFPDIVQWTFNQMFIRGKGIAMVRPGLNELLDALRIWKRSMERMAAITLLTVVMMMVLLGGMWIPTEKEKESVKTIPKIQKKQLTTQQLWRR